MRRSAYGREHWLRVQEASEHCRKSEKTIQRWADKKLIPKRLVPFHNGRYTRRVLEVDVSQATQSGERLLAPVPPQSDAPRPHMAAARSRETETVPMAARRLGIGENLIYRQIQVGTFPLPVLRVGKKILIPKSELDRFLDGPEREVHDPKAEEQRKPASGKPAPSAAPSNAAEIMRLLDRLAAELAPWLKYWISRSK